MKKSILCCFIILSAALSSSLCFAQNKSNSPSPNAEASSLKLIAQTKVQMETGNKIAEIVDLYDYTRVNYLTNSGTVMLPVGEKKNYNLSQYDKLFINVFAQEPVYISLYTYRSVNVQADTEWKLEPNVRTTQEISLAKIKPENLSDVAYIGFRIDSDKNSGFFLREMYFTGDSSRPKLKGYTVPNILTVDCSRAIRDATHCASGSLYGVTDIKPYDIDELIVPLKPKMFTNPALSENGCQWPFGDAIKTAERIKNSTGTVTIRLSDIYPGWPYRFVSMEHWFTQIDKVIKNKKESGLTNFYGYEIWNEPDLTWKSTSITFEDFWKQTYDYLRAHDPETKIIGPSYAIITRSRIKNFYQFCLENDCMPDIVCWHELTNVGNTVNTIKMYRKVEKELGLYELPISINEYSDGIKDREGCPGPSACYIGKFERYGIDTACISWWFTGNSGCLGSLLTPDFRKAAGWYLYKWYGDMSGKMLYVTPVNENSKYVDGAACYDKTSKTISCIFGGANDGTIQVDFKNLPEGFLTDAKVKVEVIEWENRTAFSAGPYEDTKTAIIERKNGVLSVSLLECDETYGYRILLEK